MFNATAEFEALQDEFFAMGDARRCPRHPNVKTSSDDGMFDTAGCYLCEAESDRADELERWNAMSPAEQAAERAECARLDDARDARLLTPADSDLPF